ncbi:MAG: hypothetical protein ACP5NV_00810 [Candidatus Woesearchaeota archaeon]
MNLRQISEDSAQAFSSNFNKLIELNLSKQSKYDLILQAYESRDVKLLEKTILEIKKIVETQKELFDKFDKSFNVLYNAIIKQIKVLNSDSNFLQRWISGGAEFKESLYSSLYAALSDIKMYIDDQFKLLEQINGKDSLNTFFKIKMALNSVYKSEVEMFFYINDSYKNPEFENYKKYLQKRLNKYNKELKNKNMSRYRIEKISKYVEAIGFIVYFIDIFRKIKIRDEWINSLYEKIDEIDERFAEHASKINHGALIVTQQQFLRTIR